MKIYNQQSGDETTGGKKLIICEWISDIICICSNKPEELSGASFTIV